MDHLAEVCQPQTRPQKFLFKLELFFFLMFIFERERERERERGREGEGGEGAEIEGDRGSQAGSVLTANSLIRGSNS